MENGIEEIRNTIKLVAWIARAIAVPIFGAGLAMFMSIMRVREETSLLVKMHRDPDEYGFGTCRTNEAIASAQRETVACLRDNTRAMEALTHYLQWSTKQIHGLDPPPPIDSGNS